MSEKYSANTVQPADRMKEQANSRFLAGGSDVPLVARIIGLWIVEE
jgi:hypothetical protein